MDNKEHFPFEAGKSGFGLGSMFLAMQTGYLGHMDGLRTGVPVETPEFVAEHNSVCHLG
jgi:hypothetical protein